MGQSSPYISIARVNMQIQQTDALSGVLDAAKHEAHSLNQSAVEPEHLLLALVNCHHCRVSSLLREHHIDRDGLRTAIRSVLAYHEDPPAQQDLPLSHRAQRLVNYARTVARQLGDQTVTTQALMASLLEDQGQRLARALRDIGRDPEPLFVSLTKHRDEPER
jgi:ATP-dependent Clp protease ATP-binding subunit ClpA